jgi:hypothetical protein
MLPRNLTIPGAREYDWEEGRRGFMTVPRRERRTGLDLPDDNRADDEGMGAGMDSSASHLVARFRPGVGPILKRRDAG